MDRSQLNTLLALAFVGAGALLYANHINSRKRIATHGPTIQENTGFRFVPNFKYDPFKDLVGESAPKVSRPVDMTTGQPVAAPKIKYSVPPSGFQYLNLINATEKANRIPHMLLARLLQQESNFLPEVINGSRLSHVGAMGIAQVMPHTAVDPGFGVPALQDPLDPKQAIPWAGRYLKALYNALGATSWQDALAAYNWGYGNVRKHPRTTWPGETSKYVADITRDVPVI